MYLMPNLMDFMRGRRHDDDDEVLHAFLLEIILGLHVGIIMIILIFLISCIFFLNSLSALNTMGYSHLHCYKSNWD